MVLCLFYPAFRSSFLFAYTGLPTSGRAKTFRVRRGGPALQHSFQLRCSSFKIHHSTLKRPREKRSSEEWFQVHWDKNAVFRKSFFVNSKLSYSCLRHSGTSPNVVRCISQSIFREAYFTSGIFRETHFTLAIFLYWRPKSSFTNSNCNQITLTGFFFWKPNFLL